MYRKLFSVRTPINILCKNYVSSTAKPKPVRRLFAAACVECMPRVTPEMTDVEKRFFEHVERVNIERSFLSDHELRILSDIERAKKKEKKDDEVVIETALDFEDKYKNQLKEFQFASRTPAENNVNNYQSINRVLDKKLILLVKNKANGEWEFPSIEWQDGESLRETAERSLQNYDSLKVDFMGNAPVGFWKPENNVRTYFFKAQLLTFTSLPIDIEYVWVNKAELKNFVKSEEYLQIIERFLLDF